MSRNVTQNRMCLSAWLLLCAAAVFLMAVIGAITRLTESGLSITEWRPVTGAIPPLHAADWQHAFDLYRATPEYAAKNVGMTLAEFKNIYFWEWLHRLWGRLIGVVYALPLLVFWLRRMIPPGYGKKLLLVLALGGMQGFVGWFMVQSGLVDRPSVSHYRLAMHLILALVLFAALLWLALSLRGGGAVPVSRGTRRHGWVALGALFLTIIWGALTAGLDAGLIYNEFPTMGAGRLVPVEITQMSPFWLNILENHAGVQFTHRVLALVTFLLIAFYCGRILRQNPGNRAALLLAAMVFIQIGLGIATILSVVYLPIAVAHQAGAMMLLALLVINLHAQAPRDKNQDRP